MPESVIFFVGLVVAALCFVFVVVSIAELRRLTSTTSSNGISADNERSRLSAVMKQ